MPIPSTEPRRTRRTYSPTALGWSLGLRAQSTAAVIDRVEKGFSLAALERIQRYLGLEGPELAVIIGTSPRTLARRRRSGRLGPGESDRLYRLARLFELAVEVFGEGDLAITEARQWFHTPQWGLGDRTPLSYVRTETGAREVEKLLNRIDYGVLA